MIQSRFVADILDLVFDDDEAGGGLKAQIPFLTEADYDYTGYGVFIGFTYQEGISAYKHRQVQARYNGVELTAPEFEGIAYVDVVIYDYLIDYIEIMAAVDEYPKRELTHYTLKQDWRGCAGRQITR